tara:strand:- start:523 stop:798 length:276 start_codon:yes stop_codon:yes gene_type:complete
MAKEIKQSELLNEINILILKKIKTQLKKELDPNQLNSIARVALAFQKIISIKAVDQKIQVEQKESFKKAMSLLDDYESYRVDKAEIKKFDK